MRQLYIRFSKKLPYHKYGMGAFLKILERDLEWASAMVETERQSFSKKIECWRCMSLKNLSLTNDKKNV